MFLLDSETELEGAICPWRVRVQPGQKVKLTLYDFAAEDMSIRQNSHREDCIAEYAQVRLLVKKANILKHPDHWNHCIPLKYSCHTAQKVVNDYYCFSGISDWMCLMYNHLRSMASRIWVDNKEVFFGSNSYKSTFLIVVYYISYKIFPAMSCRYER